MSGRDIWVRAKFLIEKYGDEAVVYAALRTEDLLDKGDLGEAATWHEIIKAIEAVEKGAQDKPVQDVIIADCGELEAAPAAED